MMKLFTKKKEAKTIIDVCHGPKYLDDECLLMCNLSPVRVQNEPAKFIQ